MRILVCNEHYAPVGGAEIYLMDAISRLEKMGHEVGVLHDTAVDKSLENARPHFCVPGSMGFIHDKSPGVAEEALKAVRKYSPEILYFNQVLNPGVTSALLGEFPSVRYVHDIRLSCPSGRRLPRTWDGICTKPFDIHCLWEAHTQLCMPRRPDTALRVWNDVRLNLKASRRMNRILVASRYVRDLLVQGGTPEGLIEILPYYTHLTSQIENAAPAAERRVLTLGRIGPEKGFQFLIEALSYLEQPTILEIAGDGDYVAELREMAAKAPERHSVEFTGWVGREDLMSVYGRARVVAVPSVWPEPFGIVGIEAMAHGLPVVAFDVGGIPDWLTNGRTGALVARKDIPALAQALDRYLSGENLARRHGEAGREEVRNRFLPEHHFGRLVDVLEEAALSRRR